MAIALPVDSDSEAASKRRRGCRVPWPPGALWHPFPSPAGPGSTETFARALCRPLQLAREPCQWARPTRTRRTSRSGQQAGPRAFKPPLGLAGPQDGPSGAQPHARDCRSATVAPERPGPSPAAGPPSRVEWASETDKCSSNLKTAGKFPRGKRSHHDVVRHLIQECVAQLERRNLSSRCGPTRRYCSTFREQSPLACHLHRTSHWNWLMHAVATRSRVRPA